MIPPLFRIFFPTWRFFEDLTPIPKVFIRWQSTNDHNESTQGPWRPLPKAQTQRRWRQLFHNPEENLRLSLQVQIEQLLNDIAHWPTSGPEISLVDIEGLSSYHIVSHYIRQEALRHWPPDLGDGQKRWALQFKIGALEFHSQTHQTASRWEDSLQSPFLEL